MMSSSTRSIPPNDVRGPSPKHRKFERPSYGRHRRVKSESGSMARLSTLTVFFLAVTFPGVILSCFSFCIQSSISPKNQVATVRASHLGLSLSSGGSDNESFGSEDGEINPETSAEEEGIDISLDSRLYKVRISRASGIDWGTDFIGCNGCVSRIGSAICGGQVGTSRRQKPRTPHINPKQYPTRVRRA